MKIQGMSGNKFGHIEAIHEGKWVYVDPSVLSNLELDAIVIRKRVRYWVVPNTPENQAIATAQLMEGEKK